MHTFADRPDPFQMAAAHLPHEQAAYRAGRWVAAALLGDHKAADYCERTKGLSLVKAQATSPNSAGGFLVPTEIENSIIAQRNLAGVVRQNGDVRTMGSDVRMLPKRVTGINVGFIPEGQPYTDSTASFTSIGLTAKKAGALTKVSDELYEDEAVDLGRFFVEEFGNALAAMEDSCAFNGDGTSTYSGMSGIAKILIDGTHDAGKVSAASGHDLFSELDAADLGTLMAALPEQYWPNAKWYASSYAIGTVFARLGMTGGGLVQTVNGPRQQFSFGGCPIVPTNSLPGTSASQSGKVMIGFGDLKQSTLLGWRRELKISSSEHVYFAQNQIAFIGDQRFDVVNHALGDNMTAGAFVGLVGN